MEPLMAIFSTNITAPLEGEEKLASGEVSAANETHRLGQMPHSVIPARPEGTREDIAHPQFRHTLSALPYYLDLDLPEVRAQNRLPENDRLTPEENDAWILREQALRWKPGEDRGSDWPVNVLFEL